MGFLNQILESSTIEIFSQLENIQMNGITKLVKIIIDFFSIGGSIAVGIIIFSLILKTIPLPLDIYSRVANKKNALKMERMRPELERLQRQYANNKQLYSQKMMALYKKEGYSTTAACLPTIITLIFFIFVINAFTSYSSYAKVDTFNQMALAYNESIDSNTNLQKQSEGGYIYEVKDASLSEDEKKIIIEEAKVQAQDKAAEAYFKQKEKAKFLWVQNIWLQDSPFKKAFITEEEYKSIFSYSAGCSCKANTITSGLNSTEKYKELTKSSKLDEEKNKRNGYLILVILSIVSMLISQLIMTKSQKAQMELQSVDGINGQAAQTTKMMTWMMPIMFGVFAFMYTASFSLYLIISTVFSTLSTMIINKIVEMRFKKKIELDEQEKINKRFGHINNKKED